MAGRTPVLDPPKVAKSILAQFQRLQSVCGCLYCVRPVSRQRHGRRAEQETAAHVTMAKGREKGKEQRGKGEGADVVSSVSPHSPVLPSGCHILFVLPTSNAI